MAVYAVGDVQGCYDELRRLLDRIKFDPAHDILWLAGDLVNRGPSSLKALRYVKRLGKHAVMVLGNHDLHLLAVSEGNLKHGSKDHTLDPILQASDREELLLWLRHRPLLHYSKKLGYAMVHAGLPPQWSLEESLKRAQEVEKVLQGKRFHDFCMQMYGNEPSRWSPKLKGMERLRFITNCLTRLRYCDAEGNLALKEKGAPGSQRKPYLPWFEVPKRASRHSRILFGHWSTLGYSRQGNTWALDSGCLWGGELTAVRLHHKEPPRPFRVACAGAP